MPSTKKPPKAGAVIKSLGAETLDTIERAVAEAMRGRIEIRDFDTASDYRIALRRLRNARKAMR